VTVLARPGIGVVGRAGAVRPDISTPEDLKRALLAAKSITYPDPMLGGPSGVHFGKVLDRLGIADQTKPKTVFPKTTGGIAVGGLVASGEAEIGVHQIQELLPVAGIELIGPLPNDLQNTLIFAAAIMTGAKDTAASKALIELPSHTGSGGRDQGEGYGTGLSVRWCCYRGSGLVQL
jgi:molybdate transport system substrate-binding protein